jgi:hypothetical protein
MTALSRALPDFRSAFVRRLPDADQPLRHRTTSAACQAASAISPTARIQSSGLPKGCSARVAIPPDWSADCSLPLQASCSASHATSRCTAP